MSEAEHADSAIEPDVISSEVEQQNGGLLIRYGMDVPNEMRQRVPINEHRMREGMRLLGIDGDEISQTGIFIRDLATVEFANGAKLSRGLASNEPYYITHSDGTATDHKYAVEIFLRNADGSYADADELNKRFYHELTHVRQFIANGVQMQPRYHNEKLLNAAVSMGRAGAALLPIATGLGAEASAAYGGKIIEHMPNTFLFEHLPNVQAIATIGLGIAAVMSTVGLPSVYKVIQHKSRTIKQYAVGLLHAFDRNENQARANEAMARQYPVFEIVE